MLSKTAASKIVVTAAIIVIGAGSATAATESSGGAASNATSSVSAVGTTAPATTRKQASPNTLRAGTSAVPATSGRQGNGPSTQAPLPGLCRAQIASAGPSERALRRPAGRVHYRDSGRPFVQRVAELDPERRAQ